MVSTWKSFFSLAIFYSYPVFLPPFVSSSLYRLGYLINFLNVVSLSRCILWVLDIGKPNFEYFFLVVYFGQSLLESSFFFAQKKSFDKYLDNVNTFIESTDINPVNRNRGELTALWNKFNPKKFQIFFCWAQVLFATYWIVINIQRVASGDEFNPYPFYSPFFPSGMVSKWFYTILDTFLIASVVLQTLQADLVFIVLLTYTRCQFLYLNALLDDVLDPSNRSQKLIKWWIGKHSDVLAASRNLSDLLKPHIFIKYIALTCTLAFVVLTFFDPHTKQNPVQKILANFFHFSFFGVFGYLCNLADKVVDAQEVLSTSLYKPDIIYGKKKESYFLRMLILRCQNPIRMKGDGFFNMCRKNFKDLSFQVYSFSSSLLSIKS